MGTTADLRPGAFIRYNGELCQVLESQHRTPGNLRAFYQVKMRNTRSGKLLENRFRAGETIEFVRVDKKSYQFLYRDGTTMYFMDQETYDQIPVHDDTVGDAVKLLKENQEVSINFEGDLVLGVEMPPSVNLRIIHTEPGVKGDTATNVVKPATVETGAMVNVPLFINEGDMIRVDTSNGSYMDRVKE
ncbi:MAG: elongation factor P [Candidatus Kapabacteria bacterium]|jgi:elongation factor P|nr:elongation factor P [Candidatus Kapabacteria bacterium]